jgi:AcrR family transcriptional regulator
MKERVMEKSTDAKRRILLAAKKLFATQGFDGTTVRQICDEAGANVALVSYYFGGKENVFFALFEEFIPVNQLPQYEEQLKEPVEGVSLIIREVIRFRMEDPEMAKILRQEIILQSPRMTRIQPYVFPVWIKLRELLKKGWERGIFQFRSLDNAMLFVMGAIIYPRYSTFLDPLLSERSPSFEELVDDTTEFVLRGLGIRA